MSYIFGMFFKSGIMSFNSSFTSSSSSDELSFFGESLGGIKGIGLVFGFGMNDDFFHFFLIFFIFCDFYYIFY